MQRFKSRVTTRFVTEDTNGTSSRRLRLWMTNGKGLWVDILFESMVMKTGALRNTASSVNLGVRAGYSWETKLSTTTHDLFHSIDNKKQILRRRHPGFFKGVRYCCPSQTRLRIWNPAKPPDPGHPLHFCWLTNLLTRQRKPWVVIDSVIHQTKPRLTVPTSPPHPPTPTPAPTTPLPHWFPRLHLPGSNSPRSTPFHWLWWWWWSLLWLGCPT